MFWLLWLGVFLPVLAARRYLAEDDGLSMFLPYFYSSFRMWSPHIFSGFPLMADPQFMAWYPLKVFLPKNLWGWNILILTGYVLASTHACLLTRGITGSWRAGFVSGLTYGFSGFLTHRVAHVGIVHAAAWVPLILLSVHKLSQGARSVWLPVLSVSVAMCMFAGAPQIWCYALVLAACYLCYRCFVQARGRMQSFVLCMAGLWLGIGIAAVQLLPAIELASESVRDAIGFPQFTEYSLPWAQLLTLLSPDWSMSASGEYQMYVGQLTLLLGAVAVAVSCREKGSPGLAWLGIAIFSCLLALGANTPLAHMMYWIPFVNKFRVPARHLLEFTLSLSVLAGMGVHALESLRGVAMPKWLVRMVLILGVCMVGVNLLRSTDAAHAMYPGIGVLSIMALVLWKRLAGNRRFVFLVCVYVLDVVAGAYVYTSRRWYPQTRDLRCPDNLAALREPVIQGRQRVVSLRGAFGTLPQGRSNLTAMWGLPNVSGYNPLILARYRELADTMYVGLFQETIVTPSNTVLDLLGGRYLLVPRAYLQQGTCRLEDGIPWMVADMQVAIGAHGDAGEKPFYEIHAGGHVVDRIWITAEQRRGDVIGAGAPLFRVTVNDVHGSKSIGTVRLHRRLPGKTLRMQCSLTAAVAVNTIFMEWIGPEDAGIVLRKITTGRRGGHWYPMIPFQYALRDRSRWRLWRDDMDTLILENQRAMPRAWFVQEVRKHDGRTIRGIIQSGRLPDGRRFDPGRTALVERDVFVGAHPALRRSGVAVWREQDGLLDMGVDTMHDAMLVVSNMDYPGWRASIDEEPAVIYRTNGVLQGIVVPGGRHHVRFQFQPASLLWGKIVTILSSGVLAVLLAYCRRHAQRP